MKHSFNNPILKERRRELRRNSTKAEQVLWHKIKNKQLNGHKFWRQYSIDYFIVDFYCPKKRLAIELDGSQHAHPESKEYDNERTAYLNNKGIRVLRFWNHDVINHTDAVIEAILHAFNHSASPS